MIETRVLRIKNQNEAVYQIKKIGAYSKSVPLMSPKTITHTIKIKKINAFICNILKQQMLSLGGDVAVSMEVITKSPKKSDCLVFGTISQLEKLYLKLKRQPLGLDKIGKEIKEVLLNYQKTNFEFICRKHKLRLEKKIYIMGILNITPDSFSDGGKFYDQMKAIARGLGMIKEGADIIDIGGESTRPNALSVSSKEQIKRVIPVIKRLSKESNVPISIDTRNSDVAHAAIKAGASIINDISGLKHDRKIAQLAAQFKTGLILMHIKGTPRTMQKNPKYKCLIQEIIDSLKKSINLALDSGVRLQQIIIDPGIGFGKTTEHNLMILKHLLEFKSLGLPILVGTSRKSLIGNVLNLNVDQRLIGTATTVVHSILQGAHLIRTHDVKQIKQVVDMTEAIEKIKCN